MRICNEVTAVSQQLPADLCSTTAISFGILISKKAFIKETGNFVRFIACTLLNVVYLNLQWTQSRFAFNFDENYVEQLLCVQHLPVNR